MYIANYIVPLLFPFLRFSSSTPYLNFSSGTAAYDKLASILTAKLVLGDVKKLSPDAQTSCLEGFHATLNHWHPKMIGFLWLGSFCRYYMKNGAV